MSNRICTVADCKKPYKARGFCSAHWKRWRTYGNPLEPLHGRWDGHIAGSVGESGYRRLWKGKRLRREHILIAERALGKPLPLGAIVHHVNEVRHDNRPENLVICPDQAYHSLLHLRMRASDAGVPLDWRKCSICGTFGMPSDMYQRKDGGANHRKCHADYERKRRHAKVVERIDVQAQS